VIGLFRMTDENGPDAKLITVPRGEPRWPDVSDLATSNLRFSRR
jgi:inorganic pyrophosphatase